MRALVVTAILLGPRLAAADCVVPEGSVQTAQVAHAVYLGTYRDLAGHAASFFYVQGSGDVLGPLDHEAYPASGEHAVAAVPGVPPGVIGTVTLRGWMTDPKHPGPMSGLFEGFAASRAPAALDAIVGQIDDGLVLGLLAGASPVQDLAAQRVAELAARGRAPDVDARLELAAQGILYAAPLARAQALLGQLGPRGVQLASLTVIAAVVRGGTRAIAGGAAPPAPGHDSWIDYLPTLAAAWTARPDRDLRGTLDDAALGRYTPILPPPPAATPTLEVNPFRCGPQRTAIRGPFAGASELTDGVMVAALRVRERAFTDHVLAAFAGLSAGAGHVVAVRTVGARHLALIAAGGGSPFVAVDVTAAQAASLELGTAVTYVAHATGHDAISHTPALEPREMVSELAGPATRLTIGARDVPALLKALQASARSGNLPYAAGPAIAALFELAGHVPGWQLADARQLMWSLPGNVYDKTFEWSRDWSGLLGSAIRAAGDGAMADEVERALPTIIARFAYRGRGAAATLDPEPVREFAIDIAIQIAARRIVAGDLDGADRILVRADGPLSALVGKAAIAPETTRDNNHDLELATMQVMVATLRHQPPPPLPPSDHRAHAVALLRGVLRPYTHAVTDPWFAALVTAGFPKPPAD